MNPPSESQQSGPIPMGLGPFYTNLKKFKMKQDHACFHKHMVKS